jgi:hypothetical protein
MHIISRSTAVILAVTALASTSASSVSAGDAVPAAAADAASPAGAKRFAGNGQWAIGSAGGQSRRSFYIDAVKHNDGAVEAKLNLPGVEQLDGVSVVGHMMGREAFGALVDRNGRQISSFNVTLDKDGTGGTFILANGQRGSFEYGAATRKLARTLMQSDTEVK